MGPSQRHYYPQKIILSIISLTVVGLVIAAVATYHGVTTTGLLGTIAGVIVALTIAFGLIWSRWS